MHVSTSAKFWDNLNEKFFTKYAGIDSVHKLWASEVMAGRPLIGPLGREWLIPIPRDKKGEIYCPWTVLTNFPVQGTAADVMVIARISFARRLKASGIPAILIQTVHDSIVVDAPQEYTQQIVDMFHAVFRDLIDNIKKVFGYTWTVPLECETSIGMNLLEMKEIGPSS